MVIGGLDDFASFMRTQEKITMSIAKLAFALLATTALAGSSFALAGSTEHGGDTRPAAMCSGHQHHTEALDTGMRAAATMGADQETKPPPLWDNLGNLTWKITTKSETAQNYFNQGLRLTFAFNHGEARRSFRAAEAADPGCAMCYWGEALVLGPNINAPMQPTAIEPAFAASAKAQALSANTSPKEQGLIRALAKRYSPDPKADRHALDAAYADAMTIVAPSFADDDSIQALFAESLMDLSPWNYWQADATTPKGRTAEAIAALEAVLKRNPNHPGAIHYYIHLVEASTTPQRAEPYAERLAALMPGTGHIVHMPAHIYYRLGRYKDSLDANLRAIKVDEAYFAELEAQGLSPDPIYHYGYYPHNVHFVLVSAQMAGDGAQTIAAAEKLQHLIPDAVARKSGRAQAVVAAPYYAHARFSSPDTVLALPEPPPDLPLVRISWHYARAIADVSRGDLTAARAEDSKLADLAAHADFAMFKAQPVPAADVISIARAVIAGRIATAEGNLPAAIDAFQRAVSVQDRLPYFEPPFWYYPVRQSLAAAQLAAGRTDDAIETFRASLADRPNNAYALYGLAEALKQKGERAETERIEARFRDVWLGSGTPDLKAL
jgi:tetratricopeptide (TPR) repeat protein